MPLISTPLAKFVAFLCVTSCTVVTVVWFVSFGAMGIVPVLGVVWLWVCFLEWVMRGVGD